MCAWYVPGVPDSVPGSVPGVPGGMPGVPGSVPGVPGGVLGVPASVAGVAGGRGMTLSKNFLGVSYCLSDKYKHNSFSSFIYQLFCLRT